MSIIKDEHNLKKLPNQSLSILQCGLTICHSGHTTPSRIYKDYSAHFILEGKGEYTVNGKTYRIESGQGFLITPDASAAYAADKSEPWKYIYATFHGLDADAIVHNAGLDEDHVIFSFPTSPEMINTLYAMYESSKSYDAKGYDVLGHFLLVMSHLIKANKHINKENSVPENYVNKAIQYIEDNYPYNISISDIASYVGIDRTYLYRLFQQYEKQSPSKYLNDYRLSRAIEMLENKSISINEVGLSVGFHDVAHFYKAFSAKYGTSPKKYRLKNIN